MRIAFTHNLALTKSEEEAEFDRPETVTAITEALRRVGHEVEPVEVSGPASRVVARLEALNPDLIFNTAEGTRGRFREAFHPALFERLGMPFTGSDAYVCALTLDKQLTKLMLHSRGIKTPGWRFVEHPSDLDGHGLKFPLMCKPNFEGSSMGITVDSVVETEEKLRHKVMDLLSRFPAGVLVEEFIVGRDLVVPWLEKASPKTGGVLEPAVYNYAPEFTKKRKFQLYDYELKMMGFDAVTVKVPADIPADVREAAMEATRRTVKILGIRDLARIDYRIGEDGQVYFLEVNALPSLEEGASLYVSGRLAGLDGIDGVMDAIVRSAAERQGLTVKSTRLHRKRQTYRFGFTYNVGRPAEGGEAEHGAAETVEAIRRAIESYGHEVVELEATPELPTIMPASGIDVVFNIAEGLRGRNRETQVPALCELLDIPYTGSDPSALALALDKGLARRFVAQAGFDTPAFVLMSSGKEKIPKEMTFPVVVRTVGEVGIRESFPPRVAETEKELREVARDITSRYGQAAFAESYLPGRQFRVALIGERRPRLLPTLEIVFDEKMQEHPVYSSIGPRGHFRFEVPCDIDATLQRELERYARSAFQLLGLSDLAQVDLRLDERGKVHFLECNPLPSLNPSGSTFVRIAEAAGMDFRTLVGEIMAPALRRLRERRRERILEGRL